MDSKIDALDDFEEKFELLRKTLKKEQFNKLIQTFKERAVQTGTTVEQEFTLFRRKLVQWKLYTDGFGISKDRR